MGLVSARTNRPLSWMSPYWPISRERGNRRISLLRPPTISMGLRTPNQEERIPGIPKTQICVVHQIRNACRLCGLKGQKKALPLIIEANLQRPYPRRLQSGPLDDFAGQWEIQVFPKCHKKLRDNWRGTHRIRFEVFPWRSVRSSIRPIL